MCGSNNTATEALLNTPETNYYVKAGDIVVDTAVFPNGKVSSMLNIVPEDMHISELVALQLGDVEAGQRLLRGSNILAVLAFSIAADAAAKIEDKGGKRTILLIQQEGLPEVIYNELDTSFGREVVENLAFGPNEGGPIIPEEAPEGFQGAAA